MRGENNMVKNFPKVQLTCVVFAIVAVLCLHDNPCGITFPLFVAATGFAGIILMRFSDVTVKKESLFYLAAAFLLGISTVLTMSSLLIVFNKIFIFFLFVMFLLCNYYDDSRWNLPKCIEMIFNMLILSIGSIGRPFTDKKKYREMFCEGQPEKNSRVKYVLIGLLICIPVIGIVLPLLANADAVFAEQLRKIFEDLSVWWFFKHIFGMAFTGFIIYMVTYMWTAWLGKRSYSTYTEHTPKGEPIVGITISSVLCLIYIVFCFIQIRYLFLGGKLSLPDGTTYASYARKGFFELLFVSAINVLLVLIETFCFRKSRVLNALMTVITVCTYIIIASSTIRMLMYIQYKYLTFLRVLVLVLLAAIAILLFGVFLHIFNKDFRIFKYSVVVVTVIYIIFASSKPDYWIAKINTDNMDPMTQYSFFAETEPYDDISYLNGLSIDAAPVLLNCDALTESELSGFNRKVAKKASEPGVFSWNLSRYLAYRYSKQ